MTRRALILLIGVAVVAGMLAGAMLAYRVCSVPFPFEFFKGLAL